MLDGLPDPQTLAAGLRRAGVHLAKAAWEVGAAIVAFVEEVVEGNGEGEDDANGPEKITVE